MGGGGGGGGGARGRASKCAVGLCDGLPEIDWRSRRSSETHHIALTHTAPDEPPD